MDSPELMMKLIMKTLESTAAAGFRGAATTKGNEQAHSPSSEPPKGQ
jgi:hypothetical protein